MQPFPTEQGNQTPQARATLRRRGRLFLKPPLQDWRRLPLVVIGLVSLALVLIPIVSRTAGVPGSTAPLTAATDRPVASSRSGNSGQPPPSVAPTRPAPTPTSIRPLALPTAPITKSSASAPVRKADAPDPKPSTENVIVVDGDSGSVLFERNATRPVAPASLTKIMTAILGIEHGNLSDHVKVDVDARSLADSTVMGLEPWFDVTLEDLLYGLMLPSGNDAALAIGRYVAGNDNTFVQLMNDKAGWLGLQNTHFANPHGLDDPSHFSCPADMVAMARYGMQYPAFRKLAAATRYDIRESNISYTLYNLNPILTAYPGADGVKIGYTDNAGRSMVATAVRNGHRVYVAYMKSEAGLVPETSGLLDWAFNSFRWP